MDIEDEAKQPQEIEYGGEYENQLIVIQKLKEVERDKEQIEEVIIEEKESSLILKMVEAKEQQQLKKVDKKLQI